MPTFYCVPSFLFLYIKFFQNSKSVLHRHAFISFSHGSVFHTEDKVYPHFWPVVCTISEHTGEQHGQIGERRGAWEFRGGGPATLKVQHRAALARVPAAAGLRWPTRDIYTPCSVFRITALRTSKPLITPWSITNRNVFS